jgi:RNA polymerase sigma-32 factor
VNAVLSADQTQVTRRLPTAPQNAAANAFALTFPGTLGNLDSYIQAVHRIPMLTPRKSSAWRATCATTTQSMPPAAW